MRYRKIDVRLFWLHFCCFLWSLFFGMFNTFCKFLWNSFKWFFFFFAPFVFMSRARLSLTCNKLDFRPSSFNCFQLVVFFPFTVWSSVRTGPTQSWPSYSMRWSARANPEMGGNVLHLTRMTFKCIQTVFTNIPLWY